MCCFTSKQVSIAIALMLGWVGLGFRPAAADTNEDRYLDVRSQGNSRFEIVGDAVIAVFTDGVEFEYLAGSNKGIHAKAQTLEYNQNDQSATAKGDVVLYVPEDADDAEAQKLLSAQEAVFKVNEIEDAEGIKREVGVLTLKGGVSGLIRTAGAGTTGGLTSAVDGGNSGGTEIEKRLYTFEATEAEVTFPIEDQGFDLGNPDMRDLDIRLIGEILLKSEDGNAFRFSTRDISYVGETGIFETYAPFLITSEIKPSKESEPLVDLDGLQLNGLDLNGKFEQGEGDPRLAYVRASNVSVQAKGLDLAVHDISLEEVKYDQDGNMRAADLALSQVAGWIELSGQDLLGDELAGLNDSRLASESRQNRRLQLAADGGVAVMDGDGIDSLELSGNVILFVAGTPIRAQMIVLEREQDGYALSMQTGVVIELDFTELSGFEPISRGELETLLAR